MSVRRLAEVQPESFAFTQDNLRWAEGQIAKYPEGRQMSAVIPLLWKAQEQNGGWVPEPAIRAIAEMLGMPTIRVMEVATFYTMFNLAPVGEHFVQLCGTTPCALRGANALKEVCRKVIGEERHVTADGKLSWLEVECLGACANAPMAQINYDYFEDLDPASFEALLEDLRAGRDVQPGSQTGRSCSAPFGGDTSLTDETLYDGSRVGAWRKRFEGHGEGEQTSPDKAGRPGDTTRPEAKSSADKRDADAAPGARASDRSRREGQPYLGSGAQPTPKTDVASGSPTVGTSPDKPADPGVAPVEGGPKTGKDGKA